MNYNWGHAVLAACPAWLVLIGGSALIVELLLPIRRYSEGFPYNNSFSSEYGDRLLVAMVAIGSDILHQNPVLPGWIGSTGFHLALAVVSVGVGVSWQIIAGKQSTLADSYHNVVGVPLLMYFIGISLPLIVLAGARWEQVLALLFGAAWAMLVRIDAADGRLQQTDWLVKNGLGHRLFKPPPSP